MLTWQADLSAVLRGRIAADFLLTGAGTRIEARGWKSFFGFGVTDATGRAGSELLALVPNALDCRGNASVAISEITAGRTAVRASGEIRTSNAVCRTLGQDEVTVRPLVIALSSEDNDAVARIATETGDRLGEVRVKPARRVLIRIEPDGARLIPGLPASAPTEIELPF